jgi:hypothetical protein
LASLIAKLPDGPSARPDPATIATRLIALLPRWAGSRAAPREMPSPAGLVTKPRALLFVVLMVSVLAAHYFMDARRAPGEDDDFRAPVSGTVLPQSRSGP